MTLGTTSAPPKFKLKKEGSGIPDENQYNRIKKNLLCQPEEDDDNDFYLNYHPSSHIGYEVYTSILCSDKVLVKSISNVVRDRTVLKSLMPKCYVGQEVVTPVRMKLAFYLLQSSNNILLNEVVSKESNYWDVRENKRKALVKV
ncbi:hypothetical protein KIW84_012004 [Lathyrus oleraceus]|uniref:Uncharacterized protein n=1 Tax=Pisum sativum TaxID=3888 RepID=A0A9D5BGD8_PEA|nr:hypothetical protein KIW84_012004 [Pisum sativum]